MKKLFMPSLALVTGACTYQVQPVKPQITEATWCDAPLWVGVKTERYVRWYCDVGQEARRGTNTDGRCISALTTTAWCADNRCTTNVRAVPQYSGYNGENVVEITPTAAGPIEAWVELRHEVGLVERHPILTCEVMPQPEITIACTLRDPKTGAFVPCGAELPAGAEVHLETTARVASGGAKMPSPVLRFDGKELDSYNSYDHNKPVDCAAVDTRPDRNVRVARCTIAAVAPGTHAFEVQIDRLPPTAQSFVVR